MVKKLKHQWSTSETLSTSPNSMKIWPKTSFFLSLSLSSPEALEKFPMNEPKASKENTIPKKTHIHCLTKKNLSNSSQSKLPKKGRTSTSPENPPISYYQNPLIYMGEDNPLCWQFQHSPNTLKRQHNNRQAINEQIDENETHYPANTKHTYRDKDLKA